MRKEIIIALFFGITVGLIVAFGAWRANNAIVSEPSTSSSKDNINTPDTNNSSISINTGELTIAEPQDLDVITTDSIKVTGITNPNSIFFHSNNVKACVTFKFYPSKAG